LTSKSSLCSDTKTLSWSIFQFKLSAVYIISLDHVLVILSVRTFPVEDTPVLEQVRVGTYRELYIIIYILLYFVKRDWDSLVGIATRYGLDGPGIESRLGEIFRTGQAGHEAHPTSYTMGTGFSRGVKPLGPGVDHPLTTSAKVKEKVELYINSPSGPSWSVLE
jgi:hypothetical protein